MHPQDVTQGYITGNTLNNMKISILRSFTHTSHFNDFYKPNTFVKDNGIDCTYLNVRNFSVVPSLDILHEKKSYDGKDLIKVVDNNPEVVDKFYSDIEDKVDIITSNEAILNSLAGEERFFIKQHIEHCSAKIDQACIQCISIEGKYSIVKVMSEMVKTTLGI